MSKASEYAQSLSKDPPDPLQVTTCLGYRQVNLKVTKEGSFSLDGIWVFDAQTALQIAGWITENFGEK